MLVSWQLSQCPQKKLANVPIALEYKVKHRGGLKGRRKGSPIWRYGIELKYLEDDRSVSRLWLCKECHLSKQLNDAKAVFGAFVVGRVF
jgi:hypothetical protein